MGFPVVFRRAVTAVSIYGSALLGILASVVAARELTKVDFSRFALVFAVTGLLQLFLDVTVEEVVVKFGNRYIARADWERFHRLLRVAFAVKTAGGAVGGLAVVGAAALAPWIWNVGGLRSALLVAALVPLVQAPEGITETGQAMVNGTTLVITSRRSFSSPAGDVVVDFKEVWTVSGNELTIEKTRTQVGDTPSTQKAVYDKM
jgi:O-antigen/teichoic acid export membrane protein